MRDDPHQGVVDHDIRSWDLEPIHRWSVRLSDLSSPLLTLIPPIRLPPLKKIKGGAVVDFRTCGSRDVPDAVERTARRPPRWPAVTNCRDRLTVLVRFAAIFLEPLRADRAEIVCTKRAMADPSRS